ncbi:hypothetical protein CDD82_4425 [Ophiocordyceps australis]|uniref:Spindle pole body component n=1 Tax=Ophiocordyceps australis TaxID=1399860 RepID=A0A2C5ZST5_9HYPO|nr:hypothetical protein CDD82_4425 [Ophiocordyceps australis]
METDLLEADVFAIPDFGQTCQWMTGNGEATSLLFPLVPYLDNDLHDSFLPSSPPKQDGFFQLPLGLAASQPPHPRPCLDRDVLIVDSMADIASTVDDVWTVLEGVPAKQAKLRTWETFHVVSKSQSAAHQRPMLLSEAGSLAFDALVKSADEPLASGSHGIVTVKTQSYISSLLAMALGRDSLLFRKDEATGTFQSILGMCRISGLSGQTLQGVERQALCCGSALLYLAAFVHRTYTIRSSPCQVALASCIDQVLRAAQIRAALDARTFWSVLQLQLFINNVSALLAPLKVLTSKLPSQCSDKDILDAVYDAASSQGNSQDSVQKMMREILQRVSAPWIEFLEEWIGLRKEQGAPLTLGCEQSGKCFIKIDTGVDIDHFGNEEDTAEFCLDPLNVPGFMSDDIMDLILDAGRNLRFIREFHPNHPLVQQPVFRHIQLPNVQWLYDWESILNVEKQIVQYRQSIGVSMQQISGHTWSGPQDSGLVPNGASVLGLNWDSLKEQVSTSMEHFSMPLKGPEVDDSVGRLVLEHLGDRHQRCDDKVDDTAHWSLLPGVSFANIAATQARIFSQESLRLLFDSHDLCLHLRMLRDFHLLGSGFFSNRLSHALFDSSLESTERKTGVARRGGVMGLGLGGRENWPPASSELQLALMSVLTESYAEGAGAELRRERSHHDGSHKGSTTSLPGDVSFAIRDLAPEQMDKATNPDKIEALDFLGLSYKPPREIAAVITRHSLVRHDEIFKLLLRVLRMLYVVDEQCCNVCLGNRSASGRLDKISYRFAREAQHLIKTLASHFMDVGVAIPWRLFENKVEQVRAMLGSDDSKYASDSRMQSPEGLGQLHQEVLERIACVLLLNKRQEPALKLIEELFDLVLRHDKLLKPRALERSVQNDDSVEIAQLYATFEEKMKTFVAVCRVMSEKMGSVGDEAGEIGSGQDGLLEQLLVRLNFDSYYGEPM